MSAAWELRTSNHIEKLVLIRIADRADEELRSFPGIDSLVRDCQLSRSSVIRAIAGLERQGHLKIERKNGVQNHYRITIPTSAPQTRVSIRHGCPTDTPPVSNRHGDQCLIDTPPVSNRHPNPQLTPIEPPTNPQTASQRDPLPVPGNLKTQKFIKAWQLWMTFRHGMKKPGKTPWDEFFRGQLEYLSKFSADAAAEMLDRSRVNGWQGIFEIKTAKNGIVIREIDEQIRYLLGEREGLGDSNEDWQKQMKINARIKELQAQKHEHCVGH